MYCKGTIVYVSQCAGGLGVVVEGESPGTFIIDNCMIPSLLDPDGPGLIGRHIEFVAGLMRLLDKEDAQVQEPTPIIPFHNPARL